MIVSGLREVQPPTVTPHGSPEPVMLPESLHTPDASSQPPSSPEDPCPGIAPLPVPNAASIVGEPATPAAEPTGQGPAPQSGLVEPIAMALEAPGSEAQPEEMTSTRLDSQTDIPPNGNAVPANDNATERHHPCRLRRNPVPRTALHCRNPRNLPTRQNFRLQPLKRCAPPLPLYRRQARRHSLPNWRHRRRLRRGKALGHSSGWLRLAQGLFQCWAPRRCSKKRLALASPSQPATRLKARKRPQTRTHRQMRQRPACRIPPHFQTCPGAMSAKWTGKILQSQ